MRSKKLGGRASSSGKRPGGEKEKPRAAVADGPGRHEPVAQARDVGARGAPASGGVVGEELARCPCGGVEGVVPRREENVVAVQLQGARKVDGVVPAEGVLGGEVAGMAGQWFVDRDGAQLGVEILERDDRAAVRRLVDAASASSRGERRACLGVDELAGDEDVGAIPELDRELGARFVEDQLDKRRRIEVDDQRR
jgi:hypothetical protein